MGIYLLVGITRSKVFFHSGKHDVQSELGATYCRCHSHSSAGKEKHAPNGDMTCWTSSLEKDAFNQQQAIFTCLHARKKDGNLANSLSMQLLVRNLSVYNKRTGLA